MRKKPDTTLPRIEDVEFRIATDELVIYEILHRARLT